MTSAAEVPAPLAPLAGEQGGFAMLALDQRESLRSMLAGSGDPKDIPDRRLVEFKAMATQVLTPYATAVLLDRPFGISDRTLATLDPSCALILAADVLHQPPGQAVQSTDFDTQVTLKLVKTVGAAALKLLVMWQPETAAESRERIVEPFLQRCSDAGVAAVVEGIVVPPAGGFGPGERDEAILAAARDLSAGADLYKAQVPGYLPGDVSQVEASAHRLTSQISIPWVVLSNGVLAEDFAEAVAAACRGGASGFLAGRAIWADTVAEPDPQAAVESRSVQRLKQLSAIVNEARHAPDEGAGHERP